MILSIQLGWISQRGRQAPVNQDRVGWCIPRDWPTWQRKGALFVVADGLGGHAAGGVASHTAIQAVLNTYYAHPSPYPAHSLQAAVEEANRWVRYWAWQRADLRGMGTTLCATAVWGDHVVVAHVGDSRAYLVRGGQAWPLTRDHTWVAEALATGMLTLEEAARHPWRHVLTRSLGRDGVAADVGRLVFSAGDRLVLITDGIAERLWDREIGHITMRPPQAAVRRLANLARRRGSRDDRTAVVLAT